MSISEKIRFETLKLDNFTCQYCGQSAPEVSLQVNHIQSTFKSEENRIHNLVTICTECYRGKNAGATTNVSIVNKRMNRLDKLRERRKEIEKVMEWPELRIDMELAAKYPSLIRVGAGTLLQ